MSDRPQKPELDNEQRLMGLLALTTQELPAKQTDNGAGNLDATMNASKLSDAQLEALYQQLDADPAALEALVRSERARVGKMQSASVGAASSRSPTASSLAARLAEYFSMPTVRYAAAFSAAGFVAFLVVLQFLGPKPAELIRQSYADLNIQQADPRLVNLVLPWERSSPGLGFSSVRANESPAAFSFAAGLLKGKRKLLALSSNVAVNGAPANTSVDDDMEKYVLLGEWNIVVWTACEAKPMPSTDFWEKQISVGETLAKATYADPEEDSTIKQHLASVHVLLIALAHGETPARTARALANELLLFRERFAPNDQAAGVQLERR